MTTLLPTPSIITSIRPRRHKPLHPTRRRRRPNPTSSAPLHHPLPRFSKILNINILHPTKLAAAISLLPRPLILLRTLLHQAQRPGLRTHHYAAALGTASSLTFPVAR